ncbi:hypothetical protein KAI87_08765, partial [Myxococcota bacterium]|nr:hypothetical protein [Myxococcota bacterium]
MDQLVDEIARRVSGKLQTAVVTKTESKTKSKTVSKTDGDALPSYRKSTPRELTWKEKRDDARGVQAAPVAAQEDLASFIDHTLLKAEA